MDKIDELLAEAKKRPDTTLVLPIKRTRDGYRKFLELFKCERCGACCVTSFEWVEFTKKEFNQVKEQLPKGGRSHFKKKGDKYLTPANPCLFYSKKIKGCSIYSKRPIRCRTYPVGYTVPDAPFNLAAHTGCPAACKTIKEAWNIAGLYGVRPKINTVR